MNHFFYSLIRFVISIFFLLLGSIGVAVACSPSIRTNIILFILENSSTLLFFSIALTLVGIGIAAHILIHARRRYYHIYSDKNAIAIDERVFQQYLDIYLKQHFPHTDIPSRLTLKNNKIHISLDFPYFPLSQQELLLERMKQDLRQTFAKLGYHNGFYLSASFQLETKKTV